MRTLEVGSGDEPVVLLNDWFGDHRTYAPALPYMDTDRFRFVFGDLRGYGVSRDVDGVYTLEEAVSDVSDLLRSLGGAHLVGHSMSSLVAQQVAVSHPELIRRLVLIGPVAPQGMNTPDEVVTWLEAIGGDPTTRSAALGARMDARYGVGWTRFKLARWEDAAHPEAVAGYVRMFSCRAVQGVAPAGVKVLASVGENDDPHFSEATVRERHAAFWPGLQVVALPSGHYPMQECPPAFACALIRFLEAAPHSA